MRRCTISGCDKEYRARGWCYMHWKHWRQYGDPLVGKFKVLTNPLPKVTGKERWLPVSSYEDRFEVSDTGVVRSLPRWRRKGQILRPSTDGGYALLRFTHNKKYTCLFVHRAVAETFIPNPSNLPCVNHLNGIRGDNHVENLEWCTYSRNTQHAYDNELITPRHGSSHPYAKLSESDVKKIIIEYRLGGISQAALANKYGVTQNVVSRIMLGKGWVRATA